MKKVKCILQVFFAHVSIMPQKKQDSKTIASEEVDSLKQEIEQLHHEVEELQRQVYRLRLEKNVLEKAAEIIKKMRASVSIIHIYKSHNYIIN